jgi:hypothetical protein
VRRCRCRGRWHGLFGCRSGRCTVRRVARSTITNSRSAISRQRSGKETRGTAMTDQQNTPPPSERADRRRLPKSAEHRAKISAALKAHNTKGGHLVLYQKSGEDHPNWKGGIKSTVYQERAFSAHGKVCNRCASTSKLLVHHIDRNRRNSDPVNLEVLCKSCHNKEHHGVRVEWLCPACGITVELRPFEACTRKFCSRTCKQKARSSNGRYK